MNKERTKKKKTEKEKIIILDPGIEDNLIPTAWCCVGAFLPLRH